MTMLKVGPFPSLLPKTSNGEREVTVWDEKGRTQIAQIFVSYGKVINAIAFQYIEDGKLVTSPLFGSPSFASSNFVAVIFKEAANNEYVTGVSGSFGFHGTTDGLIKLTIKTNVGTYGPFGDPHMYGTEFEYSFGPENQFGGFHAPIPRPPLDPLEFMSTPFIIWLLCPNPNDLDSLSNDTTTRVRRSYI